MGTVTDLHRHMEWADAAVWTSVLAGESSRTDDRLRALLYHLHMVQRAFLRVWRGEPRETPYPTLDDPLSLMGWGQGFYGEASAYLGALSEQQMAEPLPVPWATMVERRLGRAAQPTTLGETALQVALHSQYHRGQINARLRELGGEPPLVDYIAWVWLGRPEPGWPPIGSPAG